MIPNGLDSSSSNLKPPVPEDTILAKGIGIERKTFIFKLKENDRGRFLRITEEAGGHRTSIIIPASGLVDFLRVLDTMER